MHSLTESATAALERDRPTFVARRGVRVGAVSRAGDRWALAGVGGEAAIHDSKLASTDVEAARSEAALGEYDAVIVTDASAAQESWHRASAGLPAAFVAGAAARVKDRARVALFTAIVAFDAPVSTSYDAAAFGGAGGLWFAAKNNAKPGLAFLEKECWTLVSTPAWAAAEVERVLLWAERGSRRRRDVEFSGPGHTRSAQVPMRDPATGAFIPQSREVLDAPAAALLEAFEAQVGELPTHSYLHAQRWGSALPAPLTHGRDGDGRSANARDVLGTTFDASPIESFAGLGGGAGPADDFVDGGDLALYYAGDFCSRRPPGVIAAALSGRHAAEACARRFLG